MLKVLKNGIAPTRGSKFSACVDLCASEDMVIGAGETKIVGLGVAIDEDKLKLASDRDMENTFGVPCDEIDNGDGDADKVYFENFLSSHYLSLEPRSSLRAKGLISGTGVIDMDYPKEIKIIIHNPIKGSYVKSWIDFLARKVGFETNFKKEEIEANYDYEINKGDRIAQITLMEHKSYLFGIESEDERDGGFGSTDG